MAPNGWKSTSLGAIAQERRERFDPKHGDVRPYIGLEHIESQSGLLLGYGHSNEVSSAKTVFQPGDVLFGKLRPYLRKVALPGFGGVCSTDILAVRPKPVTTPDFLFAVLSSTPVIQTAIDSSAGTKMPRTSWKALSEVNIALPPLPEQREITSILSSVDEAIQATQAIIDQTRKVKQGLLQELLTRGIGHTRFKQSEIGEIPEGWRVTSLGNLAQSVTSGSRGWAKYYANSGALYIRITNLTRSSIRLDLSDVRHVLLPTNAVEGSRTRVLPGDLLISITADLGIVAMIPEKGVGEAYINQHIALVRPRQGAARSDFLAYFLASPFGQRQFVKLNDSGAKAGLNLPTIRKVRVALPPLEEQQRIATIIASGDDLAQEHQQHLEQLQIMKRGLMQDLLTGRARVRVD